VKTEVTGLDLRGESGGMEIHLAEGGEWGRKIWGRRDRRINGSSRRSVPVLGGPVMMLRVSLLKRERLPAGRKLSWEGGKPGKTSLRQGHDSRGDSAAGGTSAWTLEGVEKKAAGMNHVRILPGSPFRRQIHGLGGIFAVPRGERGLAYGTPDTLGKELNSRTEACRGHFTF